VQLLYRTVLDFNVQIYRYLGPLKKVSVEISDLKRSKCLIKNVWYKFFEFESRKHISAARSVALIFAVTGFICRRGVYIYYIQYYIGGLYFDICMYSLFYSPQYSPSI